MRLIVLLLIGLVAAGCDRQKAEAPQAPVAGQPVKGVDRGREGEAAPTVGFRDPDGGEISLADFRGKPVLVNLWASWCAPCIEELPTLQKLEEAQAHDGGLGVIAVSQDMGPAASVDAFLKGKGISRFAAFHDPDMALSTALGVQVMPTTLLFGSDGREIWRYTGDLDWTGAEAKALLAEAR